MTSLFSPEGLLRKASVFDPKKLEWMNGQHLTRLPLEELDAYVRPFVVSAGLATDEELQARQAWWLRLLDLLRVRARTVLDLVKLAEPYLRDDFPYDPAATSKHWKDAAVTADLLDATAARLTSTEWLPEPMEASLRQLADERKIDGGKLFQPLRVALTGTAVSPGIFDVLVVLGRERSLQRLSAAVTKLRLPAA